MYLKSGIFLCTCVHMSVCACYPIDRIVSAVLVWEERLGSAGFDYVTSNYLGNEI